MSRLIAFAGGERGQWTILRCEAVVGPALPSTPKLDVLESHDPVPGARSLRGFRSNRRLYQCRDLGEPYDILTWFEYAPEHTDLFERLVDRLRETKEWRYVVAEADIRLTRG